MTARKLALISFVALLIAPADVLATDPVSEWNAIALERTLAAVPAQPPVQQNRTMSIVQVAVHDAVNAITGAFDTYSSPGLAPAGASPEAAAIAAAHQALKGLFPTQAALLDARYASSLAVHGVSADDPGLEFGRSVGASVVASRANDKSAQAQFDYIVPGAGAPGVWTRLNNAPALLPGWGQVTPWVLKSGSQFRPDAPPALTSKLYARDYNEIKAIGVLNNSTRSLEQTQIAMFWRASPAEIWNGVMTQTLAARSLDLSATARAFALMYVAANDVSIACWEAKYVYNFWRPFPAIFNGNSDGNPATIGDTTWQSLLATPPHPEYPSGHTCNSSAMGLVLETLFGDAPGVAIQLTFFGATRQWQTFDQAIAEVIDARVYSGIHFRNSDEVGARLGRQVAHFVMTHALRPPTGSWKP
jgi:hypothetical protein